MNADRHIQKKVTTPLPWEGQGGGSAPEGGSAPSSPTSEEELAADHGLNDDEVKRFVEDDDEDDLGEVSWRSIMGGDLFQSRFMLRQVMFIVFVAILMLIYTGNRYDSQHEIIMIDSLKVQLQNERYNVLTQSSELLNLSRQSFIEKALKANGDSALLNPTTPPYEIVLPKRE